MLKLLAPQLPAGAERLPLAHDIAAAYALWAATQPPIKDPQDAPGQLGKGKSEGGGTQTHNINAGQYGIMVALEAAIGTRLAHLCPTEGRIAKAHVLGACSVEGVYLALAFDAEVGSHKDGFEVSGEATISIGIGETNAALAINEKLGVKGHGDDAIEAMHMAGLAIEHWMRDQQFDWKNPSWDDVLTTGKKFLVNSAVLAGPGGGAGVAAAGVLALLGAEIANALWGKNFEHDVSQTMDENDYGETSVGVGVGAFVKPMEGEGDQPSLNADLDYKHTTKVSKGTEQDLEQETEDLLDFSFAVGFGGGGWKFKLGGHIGGKLGGSTQMGFSVGMERKEQKIGTEVVGDLIGAEVRGLAHKIAKRANGFVERMADAVDALMQATAVANALNGSGGLKLKGEWDSSDEMLDLKLEVTREWELGENTGVEALEVSFEIGDEIELGKVKVRAP